MLPIRRRPRLLVLTLLALSSLAFSQDSAVLITTGHLEQSGDSVAYEVRHLPVSSFPDLPYAVAGELTDLGCLIPQTYEARRPENVVHASLESPGSSDWAVLCSAHGSVSLLVFFGSSPSRYSQLASFPETQRLQKSIITGSLGFNWGIDPATPGAVRQAQIGLSPRPPRLEHDALADSVIDHKTIYHYFAGGTWVQVDMPRE
jgi:hypothetical protein